MIKIAKKRRIKSIVARGEKLPFKDNFFDYLTIIITICFTENSAKVLAEAKRVLKEKGKIIVAIVDKDSFLGKFYQQKKVFFIKLPIFFRFLKFLNCLNFKNLITFLFIKPYLTFPTN